MKFEALIILIYLAETTFLSVSASNNPVYYLYPFGEERGDSVKTDGDDMENKLIHLNRTFRFYTREYNSFWMCINGAISFNVFLWLASPSSGAINLPYMAVFWQDIKLTNTPGTMYYRQVDLNEEPDIIQLVEEDSANIGEPITPEWVFIVTWYRVSNKWTTSGEEDTFQAVIAVDGTKTITVFNYGPINWLNRYNSTALRFEKGSNTEWAVYRISGTADMLDIADYSTVRIPGRIVTRVDGEIQLPDLHLVDYQCNLDQTTGRVLTFDGSSELNMTGPSRKYLLSKLYQGDEADQRDQCKYMMRATTDAKGRLNWVSFSVGVHPRKQSKYKRNFAFGRNGPNTVMARGHGLKMDITSFPYVEHIQDNGQDLVVVVEKTDDGWRVSSENCSYVMEYSPLSERDQIRLHLGIYYADKVIGLCQNNNGYLTDDNKDCSSPPQIGDSSTIEESCSCPLNDKRCNKALQNI